jgi:hypothetical protein
MKDYSPLLQDIADSCALDGGTAVSPAPQVSSGAQSRSLQLAHGSDIHMASLPPFPQSGLALARADEARNTVGVICRRVLRSCGEAGARAGESVVYQVWGCGGRQVFFSFGPG